MKRLVTTTLLICFLAMGATAAHASVKETQKSNIMFYEFGPSFIEGILNGPALMNFNLRGKVKFGRLSNLKRSFIPDLLETKPRPS